MRRVFVVVLCLLLVGSAMTSSGCKDEGKPNSNLQEPDVSPGRGSKSTATTDPGKK